LALSGTSWTATNIGTKQVLDDYPATLAFSTSNSVTGYAGCNQFYGKVVEMTSSTIKFDDVSQTIMFCSGEGVMEQESAFGSAVFQSVRYEIEDADEEEDQVLLLYGETGDLSARFVPLPEPTLVGPTWEVNGVPNSLWLTDQPMTISFFDDDTFSGYAGCNGFSGEWEDITQKDGHPMFRTKDFRSTRRMCSFEDKEQEQGIMDQEADFLSALRQDAVAYRIDSEWGGSLTLYATAVGNPDDNSGAPHSTVHVGQPLVKLSNARETDAY